MPHRRRRIIGLVALGGLSLSLAEGVLVSVCDAMPAMDQASAAMSMGPSARTARAERDPSALATGRMAVGSESDGTRPDCPLDRVAGTGCATAASFPGATHTFASPSDESARVAAEVDARAELDLVHTLFRPPRV
ncbi:MAG: hypothetical protein AB7T31_18010 [Gemmatimonadales bacterium]